MTYSYSQLHLIQNNYRFYEHCIVCTLCCYNNDYSAKTFWSWSVLCIIIFLCTTLVYHCMYVGVSIPWYEMITVLALTKMLCHYFYPHRLYTYSQVWWRFSRVIPQDPMQAIMHLSLASPTPPPPGLDGEIVGIWQSTISRTPPLGHYQMSMHLSIAKNR